MSAELMIVSDESDYLALLRTLLQIPGYAPSAVSYAQAESEAERRPPQVAVIDATTKHEDYGLSTAHSIARRHPNVQILVIVGLLTPSVRHLEMAGRIFALLWKPIEPIELLSAVKEAAESVRI